MTKSKWHSSTPWNQQDALTLRQKLQQVNQYISTYERAINNIDNQVSIATIVVDPGSSGVDVALTLRDSLAQFLQMFPTDSLIQPDLNSIKKEHFAKTNVEASTLFGKAMQRLGHLIPRPANGSQQKLLKELDRVKVDIVRSTRLLLAPAQMLRDQLNEELARRTGDLNSDEKSKIERAAVWPPDDDWHFRPGEAAFCGIVFRLTEIPQKLLKRLQTANGPLTREPLHKHVWPDSIVSDATLRSHLNAIRDALRAAFRLKRGTDPDPIAQASFKPASWLLDEELLTERARIIVRKKPHKKRPNK